jgi:hypothetical protein
MKGKRMYISATFEIPWVTSSHSHMEIIAAGIKIIIIYIYLQHYELLC